MRIKFYGAASEVGRSCILIESREAKILLDAGVKMGAVHEYPKIDDAELAKLDGIIASHAHLDHTAYLPHVFTAGFKSHVYATKPTFELTNVLVNDYLNISNPENVKKEGTLKMQKRFRLQEYHKEFKIKDITVRLLPAGHILGSAMVELKIGSQRLLYTGDVNFRTTKLLDPAYTQHLNANVLITESTYGADKDIFQSEKVILGTMAKSIKETIDNGGKVLVPSFGVGRAQEVAFVLDDYMRSGILPTVPIYTDGMVNKAMRIHRMNVMFCREEIQRRILVNDDDPFKSKNFVQIDSVQARRKLIGSKDACIIITTSGMLTGGPILGYLERMGSDEQNKMLLVGYQAEGTRGRALLNGERTMEIKKRKVNIGLQIEQYNLSAHADRQQLLQFMGKVENLTDIFIQHGERSKSLELAKSIGKKHKTYVPQLLDEFSL